MSARTGSQRKFYVEVIKPSSYDDDGYVIQWFRGLMPSSSLACLHSLVEDVGDRRLLGDDVEVVANAYDEIHTVIPTGKIIKRIQAAGGRGVVLLVGVQTAQFPRATELAREFREAGVQVVIGGFHVSGCLAMLPELPEDLKAVQNLGVILFAGEAEGGMEGLLQDAYRAELKPVYNYLPNPPELGGQPGPLLPPHVARKSLNYTAFDVGRGCPFQCSFCAIINVQGHKSRFRTADDVEGLVRAYLDRGVNRFFLTDDNIARNKNWEAIFDRLIAIRETEGINLKIFLQADTMSHKIPRFIEKATRAGCRRVFIGLESVNPENLAAVRKYQNRISEYREMFQAWRRHGAVTYAGYILGFPADTPESIERDIRIIQEELPVDIVEFFVMTPLPGSADHKALVEQHVWIDPDMNKYDSTHVATAHKLMSDSEWQDIYHRAWHLYYSPEHVETLLRRAEACGPGAEKILASVLLYYGGYCYEHMHPLQTGILRRKRRSTRRPSFPKENALLFYPRYVWETMVTYLSIGLYYLKLDRIRRRIVADPQASEYTDLALTPSGLRAEAAPGSQESVEPASTIPFPVKGPDELGGIARAA